MEISNRKYATAFIEEIWNNNQFDNLSDLLAPEFKDHSLPFSGLQDKAGLVLYIKKLTSEFDHKTIIEGMACEGDMVYIQVRIELQARPGHPGPNVQKISLTGYRYLKFSNQKITDHWEAIQYDFKEKLTAAQSSN
jgi:predicted SnoaL-like aldol condensation-catalyzing enzyme